jgi:hypothetical protein
MKFLVGEDGSLDGRNDVVLAGLNHKMGFRGITNTLMNFGEGKFTPAGAAGAIGYLVGEENKGLTYMFHMMNNDPCTPSNLSVLTATNQYATCDLSGQRLPAAPQWAGVATPNFSMPALDGTDWYFNTLLNARSDEIDKVTRTTLGGYATVDFFTGLRASNKGPWDVSVWLKNAFDRRVVTRIFNSTATNPSLAAGSPVAFDMVTTNPPRQVGMTGTYRF